MSLVAKYLIGNFFDDRTITTTRLRNFAQDAFNRLSSQNSSNEFTYVLAILEAPIENTQDKITAVDTALGIQKGKTQTINQFIVLFKKTMKEKEGVIADAVGGFGTPNYIEFYPNGNKEYNKVTKSKMKTIVDRVSQVAGTHSGQLSPALLQTLQAFKTYWELNRDKHEQQKGELSDSRVERNEVRLNLEHALLIAIHHIAIKYPGDKEQCCKFFDFSLLHPVKKTKKKN